MKVIRIFLLLFIGLWLLIMVGCPGMYDSRRTAVAYKHHYDAPNEETRHELDEAHKLDRRDILVCESIMAAMLAAAVYGFIRAGKKDESHAA